MQKVLVSLETADGVDAAKLVEQLAQRGNGISVLTRPAEYATARNITFVSVEQVEGTPVPASTWGTVQA